MNLSTTKLIVGRERCNYDIDATNILLEGELWECGEWSGNDLTASPPGHEEPQLIIVTVF